MPPEDAIPHGQLLLASQPVNIVVSIPETDEDARHRRRKDMALFVAALAFVALLSLIALWVAFLGAVTPKQQEWGMGVLLLIVGGCVGFLTGKNSR